MPGKKRKAEVVQENDPLPTEDAQDGEISSAEKKKKKPKKPLDAKFGGKTEEEVMALFLPDHLKPNLDIVFVSNFFFPLDSCHVFFPLLNPFLFKIDWNKSRSLLRIPGSPLL